MSHCENSSSFLDGFAWEKRYHALDSYPTMSSWLWPMGKEVSGKSSSLSYAVSPIIGCQASVIWTMFSLFCGDRGELWQLTQLKWMHTHTCLCTGNQKWCIGCLWWEYSKDSSRGLLGRAAEQTSELFRLLILIITSVVAINLFWRNEWGKADRSFTAQ